MRLYLLRHGTAELRSLDGPPDEVRALVPKGRKQCRKIAAVLRRMADAYDHIVSSPLRRARETAEEVAKLIDHSQPILIEPNLSPATAVDEAIRSVLDHGGERLIAVGHEPLLSWMGARLVGDDELGIVLRKGGLIELELTSLDPPRAALVGLLRPGHL